LETKLLRIALVCRIAADSRILFSGVAAVIALGGCSGASPSGPSSTLNVSERDFHISAPTHLRAGNITIHDRNSGPARQ